MAANNHPKDEPYLSAVIPKRIKLFEQIQANELEKLKSRPHDPIEVTLLPDGNVKEGKRWETTPMNIAAQISKSLANSALIATVDDVLWDMNRPLEGDCKLEISKFDSHKGRDTLWHSSAHILGQVLEQEYGCKLCIGPCTTRGEGFYYDGFYGDLGDLGLSESHFPNIEAGAAKAVKEAQPFERIEVTQDQALEMFSDNKFKVEIVKDLPVDKTITVYRCGPLVDLCRGPHIPNTSFVKAFKCLKASSAYWKGKSDRESLQRVYGISFPDQKQLKKYLQCIEEAKKYDHRVLGQKQELFFCHPQSPGSWFFEPHGTRVYKKLMEFILEQYWKRGYSEVITPNMYNMSLWETSGHAANYKENMFTFDIEKQEFGLKPMNCPGHCLWFQHGVRSYRELPIRVADFGVLHRNEASGALGGLTRCRRFLQDDAHIFCKEDQVKDEVKGVLELVDYVYKVFGFTYELKLSTRPEKYLGDLKTWDKAEENLKVALEAFGPYQLNKGDGAFYGPKIDITVSDAMNRKFQCATLQLDFQLPDRFELEYSAEDEAKRERPVMIHRAVLGSVERMFAILLEHYKGKWPFWLSPRQAIVCPISKKSEEYALEVKERIHEAGYYVDADTTDRKIDKKVREAQLAQYNYILVVGETEATTRQVSVRLRDSAAHSVKSIDDLLEEFKTSSAYWKGKLGRESLQRVYGISYPDQKQLKNHLQFIEEAKKHDHRVLGQMQELFFCHQLSPGSWFFEPHGTRVYKKLMEFIMTQYLKRGYSEVITPNMYNMSLWETSGHAANYKEDMFTFDIEKQEFGLKPMNCPGHCLLFQHKVRSYRELPIRLAEFGVLHRTEASGALDGLIRVRRFLQDDAHIFCKEDQVMDEVKGVLEFIDYVYKVFGLTYELKLSTRPEKYIGDLKTWDKAEDNLKVALDAFGKPWQINKGDGAFYGPKIDIAVSDAMNRKFQCATLQLDFQLPDRFKLEYSAENEAKRERPVMIHRTVLGSVERMFAILLEHYKGKWPFLLSPRQSIVCPVSKKSEEYALEVADRIHEARYYVDADLTDRKIDEKVREAQLAQYNYILVVGENEASTGQVSVRLRDSAAHTVKSIDDLLEEFKAKTAEFQ